MGNVVQLADLWEPGADWLFYYVSGDTHLKPKLTVTNWRRASKPLRQNDSHWRREPGLSWYLRNSKIPPAECGGEEGKNANSWESSEVRWLSSGLTRSLNKALAYTSVSPLSRGSRHLRWSYGRVRGYHQGPWSPHTRGCGWKYPARHTWLPNYQSTSDDFLYHRWARDNNPD